MAENKTSKESKGNKSEIVVALLKFLSPRNILALIIIIAIIAGTIFVKDTFFTDSKATKLGFENIGELATQSAYVTEVNITENARDLFGLEIPFTQSKTIFSYDIVIKAGINFEDITYAVDDGAKKISVKMPETKILSSEIDHDSFKLYHEAESIFTPITVGDINQSLTDLTKDAEETALANGMLDEAETNAEMIITNFFGQTYDMAVYTIEFN